MRQTHYPRDIVLHSPPLGEAWLEIRWQMQQSGFPGQAQDANFPFALGLFYEAVRDKYPHKRDLDSSRAPPDLLPHIVRHQFWKGDYKWPVLQLGPGIATVNFTRPYSWSFLKEEALYLREKLQNAYNGALPHGRLITLRYLNAEPFDFIENDILEFLSTKLNTKLKLPTYMPGDFSLKSFPKNLNIQVSYELIEPKGTASVMIATGAREIPPKAGPPENLVNSTLWQIDVSSENYDVPNLADAECYSEWLDSAHLVIHEWFFSFTDGELYAKYKKEQR